ncbi:MAG: hypothetical protein A3H93_18320 [Rhodocyclales bacterium RIFCSPLOWO2_02_FULL_63_24]|nr:MAG: hypothetical protein A2040_06875 [Rhodocyclales bacterium GWA2_65_19]OHC67015.1 MAG: hypothetical protein A3H93_18320 [Rhodocyclales bacterium RIFCSPLOWO2_02_FULL_63_24]
MMHLMPRSVDATSLFGTWSSLSPLRVLLAPLFAIGFLLAVIFAPTRVTRAALLGATVSEVVVFVCVVLIWTEAFR